MFRQLLCMVLVLGLAGTAYAVPFPYCGFNSGEDAPSYVVGNLTGQGSAVNGWAGPWNGSGSYQVVEGGCTHTPVPPGHANPDHHVVLSEMSATKSIDRPVDPITGDYSIGMCVDVLGIPYQGGAFDWANQFQIQLRDSAGKRGLHIKYESGLGNEFRLNADAPSMLDFMTGDGPLNLKGHTDYQWISWRIDYTAATTTYDLYWEDITGAMVYVGSHVGHKDAAFNGTVASIHLEGPKALHAGMGVAFDMIVPEPATLLLLAGAGLPLLRRRRG